MAHMKFAQELQAKRLQVRRHMLDSEVCCCRCVHTVFLEDYLLYREQQCRNMDTKCSMEDVWDRCAHGP